MFKNLFSPAGSWITKLKRFSHMLLLAARSLNTVPLRVFFITASPHLPPHRPPEPVLSVLESVHNNNNNNNMTNYTSCTNCHYLIAIGTVSREKLIS